MPTDSRRTRVVSVGVASCRLKLFVGEVFGVRS